MRAQGFVLAARGLGLHPLQVFLRHVLPNALIPATVAAAFGVAGAILAEAGLSFLGLGVPEPAAVARAHARATAARGAARAAPRLPAGPRDPRRDPRVPRDRRRGPGRARPARRGGDVVTGALGSRPVGLASGNARSSTASSLDLRRGRGARGRRALGKRKVDARPGARRTAAERRAHACRGPSEPRPRSPERGRGRRVPGARGLARSALPLRRSGRRGACGSGRACAGGRCGTASPTLLERVGLEPPGALRALVPAPALGRRMPAGLPRRGDRARSARPPRGRADERARRRRRGAGPRLLRDLTTRSALATLLVTHDFDVVAEIARPRRRDRRRADRRGGARAPGPRFSAGGRDARAARGAARSSADDRRRAKSAT